MEKRNSWAERQLPLTLPPDEKQDTEQDKNMQDLPPADRKTAKEPSVGLCSSIHVYFREYCSSSSIHGVRYFGERGRTVTERVWWFLIFIASILMCTKLILKTWDKWDTSPVIVSFAQSPTPVWQVPFPAVTICSETKARQSVYNFTEAYHKYTNASSMGKVKEMLTPEELKIFEDVSLICDGHLHLKGQNTTDTSVIDFMHEVAPQFEEMMWVCKWTNKLNTTCEELFHPMLTEEGVCYTFNMLDSPELLNSEAQDKHYLNHGQKADWSLFGGYKKGAERDVYPRRALGAGIKAGLTVLMRAYDYDLDYICKGPVQGFKILLHNPAETPRMSQQYFRAPLNQEVIVAVQPEIMTTSEGLKDYHPSRRHCYFQGEKQLRFYKVYTQQNCEVECLANFTLQRCHCVAYYMPRANNTPICGSGKTHCMALSQLKLLLREVETELAEENVEAELKKNINKCNCLPACTSLSYSAETSQADFNWPKMFQAFKSNFSEFPGIQMTRVNIFFKDTEFITSRRSELYGPTDFLANCGGLLGLFMGFSFLSLVEIIYFLTLRMWCNIKMHGRKMWNASRINSARGEPMLQKRK